MSHPPSESNPARPVPPNEVERLAALARYDLDYTEAAVVFSDLTELAAGIAGAEISLLNLIDAHTQWSAARSGIDLEQMPREDSVCQYTILGDRDYVVPDLRADARFQDKFYVAGEASLRSYVGIPLTNPEGHAIGSLCLLDRKRIQLTESQSHLLRLVGNAVMDRLERIHRDQELKSTLRQVSHDIRSPLSGMIGLSEIALEEFQANRFEQIEEFLNEVIQAGNELMVYAAETLKVSTTEPASDGSKNNAFQDFSGAVTLEGLRRRLAKLYRPQAAPKAIALEFTIRGGPPDQLIPRTGLIQIAGNLVGNAIKFTPPNGLVMVDLELSAGGERPSLIIIVSDSGPGLSAADIERIRSGTMNSSSGSQGESGFGLGLATVRQTIGAMNGEWKITSGPGGGARFEVMLPIPQLAFR